MRSLRRDEDNEVNVYHSSSASILTLVLPLTRIKLSIITLHSGVYRLSAHLPVENGEVGRVGRDHHIDSLHEIDNTLHGRFSFSQKCEISCRESANIFHLHAVDVL